jgi:SAM-dependent methyltransferase
MTVSPTPSPPAPSSPVYDTIGEGYTTHRRADPRWAALIREHLGDAVSVVNVGAGTGSYEPPDMAVVAVEPSALMVSQRRAGAAPVLRGSGTALPLHTRSFDAALAILTLHHWADWRAGLHELARVAPRRLILTIDFEAHARFWLLDDYLPEIADDERRLRPTVEDIAATLPITDRVDLPLPHDLTDGVLGARWRTPEAHLDPVVRANTSPLALADPAVISRGVARLEADLSSGAWHRRHGELLDLSEYDLGYRLLISEEA